MTLPPAVTSMRRTERLTLPPIEKNAVLPSAFIRFLWLSREVRLSANCVSVHK